MQHDTRSEYLKTLERGREIDLKYKWMRFAGGVLWLCFVVFLCVFIYAFFAQVVNADELDTADVLALEPSADGMVLGTLDGESVSLLKQENITTGRVGDDHVFIIEYDLGTATQRSGVVGDEAFNLTQFDWDNDE